MYSHIFGIAVLISLIVLVSYIPFINFLYRMKFHRKVGYKRKGSLGKDAKIFNGLKNHQGKIDTPLGGGILIILFTLFFSLLLKKAYFVESISFTTILIILVGFGLIGLYDDVKKIFTFKGGVWGLRIRHKLLLQGGVATIAFYFLTKTNLLQVKLFPGFLDIYNPLLVYILFVVVILFLTNAFNIADGLDGLSGGLLLITLVPIIVIAATQNNTTVLLFSVILLGGVLPFLYFNINPARIFMGDTGALAFGAFLGIALILLDTIYLLPILCAPYILEGCSSLLQIASKMYRKKKIFLVAPLHHHFEALGWEETKVTMRFWLFGIFCSLTTLAVYFLINPY